MSIRCHYISTSHIFQQPSNQNNLAIIRSLRSLRFRCGSLPVLIQIFQLAKNAEEMIYELFFGYFHALI
jgi:hypothetical protein